MTDAPPMKMGRHSAAWRRAIYRAFAGRYWPRRGTTAHGRFDVYVSAGAQISVLSPRGVPVDPVHTRFIDRWVEPSSVVWDVGGNMGLFAFPAALKASAGEVYVFEPDVELANWLLRSSRLKINRRLPVTLMPFALSDQDNVASFLIAGHGTSMNKLEGCGPWHDDLFVTREKRMVPTFRIDSIARRLKRPDIIKIDVEGAELRVLEGGRETIAAARPVMLIEGPGELARGIGAFLRELDYVVFDGAVDGQTPLNRIVWDTVAVPREKVPSGLEDACR